jgi:hypothetical protein
VTRTVSLDRMTTSAARPAGTLAIPARALAPIDRVAGFILTMVDRSNRGDEVVEETAFLE